MKSCLVFSQCSYYWDNHYEAQQHSICKNYFCRSCSVRFCHFIRFNCDVTLRLHFHACVVSVYCVLTSLLPLWNTIIAISICLFRLQFSAFWWNLFDVFFITLRVLVPESLISVNPGLKFCSTFLYLPPYALVRVTICVIITVSQSEGSTVQLYVVSLSYMVIDKKIA